MWKEGQLGENSSQEEKKAKKRDIQEETIRVWLDGGRKENWYNRA